VFVPTVELALFRYRSDSEEKIAQVVLAMTWFTDNYITRYGMTQSYQAEADLRCAGTTRK
jgi:hypothetical protein